MRWLVFLAVVLLLAPQVPDGITQIQQQVSFQERQFEEPSATLTSLREMAAGWMRRLDELAAALRRGG